MVASTAARADSAKSSRVAPLQHITEDRPPSPAQDPSTVLSCYDILDLANETVKGGIEDFTEGIYDGDPDTPYLAAQARQHNYLLDQSQSTVGSRVLDIGCGNGTLLEVAQRRGSHATGITLSSVQVDRCRDKGLDVRRMNYVDLPRHFESTFDALVANGSMEHFVQMEQAAAGHADAIYRSFFEICASVLKPAEQLPHQPGKGHLVTTVIHVNNERIDPQAMLGSAFRHDWGSANFHFNMLTSCFGGCYPEHGQLERCAKDCFQLVEEIDGTEDYRFTSEHWLRIFRRSTWTSPRFQLKLLRRFAKSPFETTRMVCCLLLFQSWAWQFRGEKPPTRLLRQTWLKR